MPYPVHGDTYDTVFASLSGIIDIGYRFYVYGGIKCHCPLKHNNRLRYMYYPHMERMDTGVVSQEFHLANSST